MWSKYLRNCGRLLLHECSRCLQIQLVQRLDSNAAVVVGLLHEQVVRIPRSLKF